MSYSADDVMDRFESIPPDNSTPPASYPEETGPYFLYRYNRDGKHDGKHLYASALELVLKAREWMEKPLGGIEYPEIRGTDGLDRLVLHVIDGELVWPTKEQVADEIIDLTGVDKIVNRMNTDEPYFTSNETIKGQLADQELIPDAKELTDHMETGGSDDD